MDLLPSNCVINCWLEEEENAVAKAIYKCNVFNTVPTLLASPSWWIFFRCMTCIALRCFYWLCRLFKDLLLFNYTDKMLTQPQVYNAGGHFLYLGFALLKPLLDVHSKRKFFERRFKCISWNFITKKKLIILGRFLPCEGCFRKCFWYCDGMCCVLGESYNKIIVHT